MRKDNDMEEVWVDARYYFENGKILDLKGIYKVSDLGRIISIPRNGTIKKEKVLKQTGKKNGYVTIHSRALGVQKNLYVHRLVLSSFTEFDPEKTYCNHKNEVKTDNRLENLEWCTCSYNQNFGTRNERVSKAKRNNEAESIPVNQYTIDGTYLNTYPSAREAERQTGVYHSNITGCCKHKPKHETRGGFKWEYAVNQPNPCQTQLN